MQQIGEHPFQKCDSKCDFNKIAKSNFIEITLWHGWSPVNLLHIFRTPFSKNTSRGVQTAAFVIPFVLEIILEHFHQRFYQTSTLMSCQCWKIFSLLKNQPCSFFNKNPGSLIYCYFFVMIYCISSLLDSKFQARYFLNIFLTFWQF